MTTNTIMYGDIPIGTIIKDTHKNTKYGFTIRKVAKRNHRDNILLEDTILLEMLYNSNNTLMYNEIYQRDEVLPETVEIIAENYEECLEKYPELFL